MIVEYTLMATQHENRSAASWAEHYRQYETRIAKMVGEIRASSLAAGTTSWSRPPKPVSAVGRSRGAGGGLHEILELESDEEEVEEVEEIVPLRPTRKKGKGDEPIVVISDDDD